MMKPTISPENFDWIGECWETNDNLPVSQNLQSHVPVQETGLSKDNLKLTIKLTAVQRI